MKRTAIVVFPRTLRYLVSLYFIGELLILLLWAFWMFAPSRNCILAECSSIRWDSAPYAAVVMSVATLYGILARGLFKNKWWALYASAGLFAVQLIHIENGQFRYGIQIGHGFSLPIFQDMTPIGPYSFIVDAMCCWRGNGEHALSINLIALIGLVVVALIAVLGRPAHGFKIA